MLELRNFIGQRSSAYVVRGRAETAPLVTSWSPRRAVYLLDVVRIR
jgi:hypothetical protein